MALVIANSTVKLDGLSKEMDRIAWVVEDVFDRYHLDAIITAGTEEFYDDGTLIHMVGSYHPRGYALDFRSIHIVSGIWTKIKSDLFDAVKAISPAYQWVWHDNHFHLEYDLKVAWRLQK